MNEYEKLFSEASKEKDIDCAFSKADKIMISVESEFTEQEENVEVTEEEKSRLTEEQTLKNRRKKLLDDLQKCKNIKNPSLTHINKQRADKRKEIKRKIAECDLRLSEINFERKQEE